MMTAAASPDRLELVLDEIQDTGFQQRPRLPFDGQTTGPELLLRAPAPPLSTVLRPLTLDRLTVADDPGWLDTIEQETNLPAFIATGLRGMYPG